MKKLEILTYGNPVLKKQSEKILTIDQEIKELVEEMKITMVKQQGIGLAAPQIGINKQLCVIGFRDGTEDTQVTLINPKIEGYFGENIPFEEGCLSIPGINATVFRPEGIIIDALDINGEPFKIRTSGLLARVAQHEIDHLNGILFVERLEKDIFLSVEKPLKKLFKKTNKKLNK